MSYRFFENKDCEFYPCHDSENLNCLFCFCPLYNLDCGGNFVMIKGRSGDLVKDCTNCMIPHSESGYDYVMKVLKNTQDNKQRGETDEYGK